MTSIKKQLDKFMKLDIECKFLFLIALPIYLIMMAAFLPFAAIWVGLQLIVED